MGRSGLDTHFRDAVSTIDAGDIVALQRLIAANPALVRERLASPGAWLRDAIGGAVDGFFKRPYLLWFVAEDPVRNGKLPGNIAAVARVIIDAARHEAVSTLQEQLDYALTLVSWSWIARESGVQIDLIDVLVDAGAVTDGNPNNALVNGNFAAADHLIKRGAKVTLAAALCLGRDEIDSLLTTASENQKQFSFVLSALNGKADALRRMLRAGVDVNAPSADLYSHGTPLHHAVCSGSLEAVEVLVEAGAELGTKDSAWGGTPLGWAEHYLSEGQGDHRGKQYAEIADYLRAQRQAVTHSSADSTKLAIATRFSHSSSMARSARWFIAGGYAALVAGFAIGDLLPTGSDELGIANAMGALVLGMLVAGILLLIGLVRGAQAIIRERHRVRWFDYIVLALGVAPFVFLLVALLPGK